MPKNLEVKIPIARIDEWKDRLSLIGAEFVRQVQQTDTYFIVDHGRLKLREVGASESELIYYFRDESLTERWSEYEVVPIQEPSRMKVLLSRSLGVKAVVEKHRQIFLYRNARIHLDRVTGLGEFLEFEVMELDGPQGAHQLLDFLLEELALRDAERVRASYSDMIVSRPFDGS